MSNVETYYLIDFENVNNAGLLQTSGLPRPYTYIFHEKCS